LKIGILGGTFDPMHRGHTYLARAVSTVLDLDRVLFMVSYLPPHKGKQKITSPFHRYTMVALDLLEDEDLYPSQWELDRKKSSYTIETLQYFTSHYPKNQYCFIAGSDSLKEIHLWRDYDTLLKEHCFVFVQRPGAHVNPEELKISGSLRQKIHPVCEQDSLQIRPGQSLLMTLDAPDISASSLRKIIASGKQPSSELISPSVFRYVKKHRLYEENEEPFEEGL
jgi:nicotinate-nucleotide adenylyltransferase